MSLPLAPFGSRTGLRGMVAAADQLAASAGLAMLERGGSAGDAAVATGAAMAVVGPHLCGLGGDVLAMVSPPAGSPEALLSIGRAGAGSDAEGLRRDGHQTMPVRGDIRSVQVPGAVDGWLALHERYGRLPLAEVLAPAIELATDGFPASIMLALASHLVHALPGAGELCPGGPLDIGQTVRLPGIARTLRVIAAEGRSGFYQGEFGRGLLKLGSGHFAPADFATSAASWCAPLRATAWGHELWTVPPPSQGYLTLAGAVVAEAAGLGADPDDPQWAHLLVETWRAVGHDRPAVLFDEADGEALLHPDRLAAAADRVSAHGTAPPDVASGRGTTGPDVARLADGDTTHLCVQDADGLGISLTQSNALDFGSHMVEPTTGVFLHNRGVGFSLVKGHPAEVAPGRQPPHTLSPMLVTKGDVKGAPALTHLVGAMGGDAQPQIILQLLARLLHAGQDPARAITAPRFTLDAPSAGPFRLWWGEDLTVLVEADAPPAWPDGLTGHGHRVRTIGAFDPVAVGCAQIIATEATAEPATGGTSELNAPRRLVGASDPRSPAGAALGR
jgi:gamma-glutamyltranspeptidase / glutathione hydrolase